MCAINWWPFRVVDKYLLGSFKIYVDKILTIFEPLPTIKFWKDICTFKQNLRIFDIPSHTTNLPHLVNVFFGCPLLIIDALCLLFFRMTLHRERSKLLLNWTIRCLLTFSWLYLQKVISKETSYFFSCFYHLIDM